MKLILTITGLFLFAATYGQAANTASRGNMAGLAKEERTEEAQKLRAAQPKAVAKTRTAANVTDMNTPQQVNVRPGAQTTPAVRQANFDYTVPQAPRRKPTGVARVAAQRDIVIDYSKPQEVKKRH